MAKKWIKQCPFCGSARWLYARSAEWTGKRLKCAEVGCKLCHVSLRSKPKSVNATDLRKCTSAVVNRWNTRDTGPFIIGVCSKEVDVDVE